MHLRKTAPRFEPPAGPSKGIFGNPPKYKLLGIGDSIIEGVGAHSTEGALIATAAATLSQSLNTGVSWQALGKNGARSERILNRLLPQVVENDLDFIVISAGVNDITGLVTIADFSDNLHALLNGLHAISPRAQIVTLGIPPLRIFPALPQPLRAVTGLRGQSYDLAIQDVVARHGYAVHLPVAFEAGPGVFSEDGFHPSASSYVWFGGVVAETFLAGLQSTEQH